MRKVMFMVTLAASALFASCNSDDAVTPSHTITTANNVSFDPAEVTARVGEVILFEIGSGHTATQVSEDTWANNGNVSNGGFDLPAGSWPIWLTDSDVGTIYYVCKNHVGMGMKGKIIVTK